MSVSAESEPEFWDFLVSCFGGSYIAPEPYEPLEGADNPTVWFYSGDTQLLRLYTSNDRVLFENYWYTPDDAYDFDALTDWLTAYQTEEHQLTYSGVTGKFYRSGTGTVVEIP